MDTANITLESAHQGPDEHQRLLSQAVRLHQRGRLAEAERIYRNILRLEPSNPDAMHLLGLIARQAGRPEAAIQLIRQAIASNPTATSYQANLAMLLEEQGIDDESAAKGAVPGTGQRNLPATSADLSAARLRTELERAEAALRSGNVRQSEALCRRLIEIDNGVAHAHYLLALALYRLRRIRESAEAFRRALEIRPGEARYYMDLSACCQQLEQDDEAVRCLEMAADLNPADTASLMRLATAHTDRGRFAKARVAYERALERNAQAGGVHYGLAMIKQYDEDDPQIEMMRAALDKNDLDPRNEAAICFAMGRVQDQLGHIDEAMQYFHRGNRVKRGLNPFSIETERDNTRRIIDAFPVNLFAQLKDTGCPSELPVFVIGMPRSGTTLVEQILASHPRVHGAGEINDLPRVVSRVGEWLPLGHSLPEAVSEVDPAAWATLGRRYVERLRARDENAERIVDKLPFNYTLAGIINLMLPHTRIVHCVRDARDTCVSCYLTSFGGDRGFTSDLAELGEAYRLYWQLMRHWKAVLPGRFYEVRYETLVTDQEQESRRLLDFVGLEWSDQCLDFHKNARVVTTASMTQVRQPAYKTSIGRWKRYEGHLGPLLETLGDLHQYEIEE